MVVLKMEEFSDPPLPSQPLLVLSTMQHFTIPLMSPLARSLQFIKGTIQFATTTLPTSYHHSLQQKKPTNGKSNLVTHNHFTQKNSCFLTINSDIQVLTNEFNNIRFSLFANYHILVIEFLTMADVPPYQRTNLDIYNKSIHLMS